MGLNDFQLPYQPVNFESFTEDLIECQYSDHILTHPAYIFTQVAMAALNTCGILLSVCIVYLVTSTQVSSFSHCS